MCKTCDRKDTVFLVLIVAQIRIKETKYSPTLPLKMMTLLTSNVVAQQWVSQDLD